MPRIKLGASRTIAVVFTFNMVVACTMTQDPPAETFGDPIEDVWLLGDELSSINIAPCSNDKDDGLCGTLIQVSEDDDAWSNQSNLEWWQEGPSPIVGPVAELCRSFNRILCSKGEYLWERNKRQNLDKKLCV